ncbi:hypothetical protein C2E31_25260 [Rhodopirellula baltica]|nr:hypothetical protein C2E31_25260 [Rhodopirellula baltica]
MTFYVAMLIAFVSWLLADPVAEEQMTLLRDGSASMNFVSATEVMIESVGETRVWMMGIACAALVAFTVLVGLRFCMRRQFSLRQMLTTTALIGAWCGALVASHQITWSGKRIRAMFRVDALEQLAQTLHHDWPQADGEIEGLGPFNAYPSVRPSVLLLLTPFPLQGTDTVIAAIERGSNGALRFQLGGKDGGDWIEWHDASSLPASFKGGLADDHQLQRFSEIGPNWYLVRYTDEQTQSG